MSIYEYDYDKHMKMEREQHFAEGHEAGQLEGRKAELRANVLSMAKANMSPESIAEILQKDILDILEVLKPDIE